MSIDPTSDKVALYYTGDESGQPYVQGVPARDLTENDLHRLYVVERASVEPEYEVDADGRPVAQPIPELSGAAYDSVIEAIVARLREGPYQVTEPSKASKPAKAPEPPGSPAPTDGAPA